MAHATRLAFLGCCVVVTTGCVLPKMNSDYDPAEAAGAAGHVGGKGHSGGSSMSASGGNGGSAGLGVTGMAGQHDVAVGAAAGTAGLSASGGSIGTASGGSIGTASGGSIGTASGGSIGTASGGSIGTASGGSTVGGNAGAIGNGGTTGQSTFGGSAGRASVGGSGGQGNFAGNAGAQATGGTSIAGGNGMGGSGATAGFGGTSQAGAANSAGNAGVAGFHGKPVPTQIATGWYHSCALLSDGTVKCWGNKCDGRLGDGGPVNDCRNTGGYSTSPITVVGLSNATAVAAGGYHTCAIVAGGVRCWGFNAYGQLGNDSEISSSIPVSVIDIADAKSIVAGRDHTCAVLTDGKVRCWGANLSYTGQLGDGTGVERHYPVAVVVDRKTPPTELGGVTTMGAIEDHSCAVTSSGAVYCWGENLWNQLGKAGYDEQGSTIALLADLLGTGTGGVRAVAVGAGKSHSCALLDNGTIRCWGYGANGQLGNGEASSAETPVVVKTPTGVSGYAALAVGRYHACAIVSSADGRAHCWGMDQYGQVGNGAPGTNYVTPQVVRIGVGAGAADLSQVQGIDAGDEHSCAIALGVAYCWGHNEYGQLGTGNTSDSSTAKAVVGL